MKKNELLAKMKKAVKLDFDALELKNSIERNLSVLPVLTEAELDELKEKGCWIGLGSFRVEGKENPIALVQAVGTVSTLALMVAEAMEKNPGLEKVFLLAVGLKLQFGDTAETEDNEDEDNNEDCEENQRGIVWKDTTH